MTTADFLRILIIISLGVMSFVMFIIATTILGLMWLDNWACGQCIRYPVGMWALGLYGLLLLFSIAVEFAGANSVWRIWVWENREVVAIVMITVVTIFLVFNWWYLFNW